MTMARVIDDVSRAFGSGRTYISGCARSPLGTTVPEVRHDANDAPVTRVLASSPQRVADRLAAEVPLRGRGIDDYGFAGRPVRILQESPCERAHAHRLEISRQHGPLRTFDLSAGVRLEKPYRRPQSRPV